jgi:hypothetical protein
MAPVKNKCCGMKQRSFTHVYAHFHLDYKLNNKCWNTSAQLLEPTSFSILDQINLKKNLSYYL